VWHIFQRGKSGINIKVTFPSIERHADQMARNWQSDGSSAFVFDVMERERPATDRKVLDFIKGQVFDPADFVIRTDGVCRLNPEWRGMWWGLFPQVELLG
jgi:CRISPR associated protein, Cas1 family